MTEALTKAERLVVAGYVAPHLRSSVATARTRRVARVDSDGKVVGYTTVADVQKALLLAREIEIDVADGVRPKEIVCKRCGKAVRVPAMGVVPSTCAKHKDKIPCHKCGRLVTIARSLAHYKVRPATCIACHKAADKPRRLLSCEGCGKTLSKSASQPFHRAKGRPARCRACASKKPPWNKGKRYTLTAARREHK